MRSEEALQEAHAQRMDGEARRQVEKADRARLQAEEERSEVASAVTKDAAALRLLALELSLEQFRIFVEEASEFYPGRDYIRRHYAQFGWDGAVVRNAVLEHFLKVENGERPSAVLSKGGQKC